MTTPPPAWRFADDIIERLIRTPDNAQSMAPTDPQYWDTWRRTYTERTFSEEAACYDAIAAAYPKQDSWRVLATPADPVPRLLAEVLHGARSVVELGPWRGELAATALPLYPDVARWIGYDLCRAALDETVTTDARYEPTMLTDWPWIQPLEPADLFVSCHTFEHISNPDLLLLLPKLAAYRTLYLDIPLDDVQHPDWNGYLGTHILCMSWTELRRELNQQGFEQTGCFKTSRIFARRT